MTTNGNLKVWKNGMKRSKREHGILSNVKRDRAALRRAFDRRQLYLHSSQKAAS